VHVSPSEAVLSDRFQLVTPAHREGAECVESLLRALSRSQSRSGRIRHAQVRELGFSRLLTFLIMRLQASVSRLITPHDEHN
jgi:hypothetical protein